MGNQKSHYIKYTNTVNKYENNNNKIIIGIGIIVTK